MLAGVRRSGCGRWWARGGRGGAACCALAAAAGALLLLALPAPARHHSEVHFDNIPARRLAHLLADFSVHARLYPDFAEWTLEEESGNYTWWRYAVSFRCGARCAGSAAVLARDEHAAAPRHAPPPAHTVLVRHSLCRNAPFLPWISSCEEWETESRVEPEVGKGGAESAVVRERAEAACGATRALRLLLAGSSCGAELRRARDAHLRRLADIVRAIPPPE